MRAPAPERERRSAFRLLAEAEQQRQKEVVRNRLDYEAERLNLLEAQYGLTRRIEDRHGPS